MVVMSLKSLSHQHLPHQLTSGSRGGNLAAFSRQVPLSTNPRSTHRGSCQLRTRISASCQQQYSPKEDRPNAGNVQRTTTSTGRRSILALVPLIGGASVGIEALVHVSPGLALAEETGVADSGSEGLRSEAEAAPEASLEAAAGEVTSESDSDSESDGESDSQSESESEGGVDTDSDIDIDTDIDTASESDSPSDTASKGEGSVASTGEPEVTAKVFLDIAIDGAPAGRIVIGLYGKDVPLAASRFEALAKGDRGISLRRKEFLKLTPSYVQNAGVRSFSLTGSSADEARFPGGTQGETLIAELEQGQRDPRPALHNTPGAVSILAFDPTIPSPKQRLIAKNGKLVTIEEEVRAPPNGTEFAICFEDSPELDVSHVVVGKVVEDPDSVIAAIRRVPYVQDNSESPYFKTAKLIGDTRAVVAERGFYRPYKKISILKCGAL